MTHRKKLFESSLEFSQVHPNFPPLRGFIGIFKFFLSDLCLPVADVRGKPQQAGKNGMQHDGNQIGNGNDAGGRPRSCSTLIACVRKHRRSLQVLISCKNLRFSSGSRADISGSDIFIMPPYLLCRLTIAV